MAPATRTAWWSRSRGLPGDAYASWRSSMQEVSGRTPRILAWAGEGDQLAIGSPTVLSTGGAGGWQHVGWHEIERGGWDATSSRLRWRTTAAPRRERSVTLTDPGRLPWTR